MPYICLSQGKVEESIKYLEMFVEVAEKSKDDKAISRACSDLGAVFNSLVSTTKCGITLHYNVSLNNNGI